MAEEAFDPVVETATQAIVPQTETVTQFEQEMDGNTYTGKKIEITNPTVDEVFTEQAKAKLTEILSDATVGVYALSNLDQDGITEHMNQFGGSEIVKRQLELAEADLDTILLNIGGINNFLDGNHIPFDHLSLDETIALAIKLGFIPNNELPLIVTGATAGHVNNLAGEITELQVRDRTVDPNNRFTGGSFSQISTLASNPDGTPAIDTQSMDTENTGRVILTHYVVHSAPENPSEKKPSSFAVGISGAPDGTSLKETMAKFMKSMGLQHAGITATVLKPEKIQTAVVMKIPTEAVTDLAKIEGSIKTTFVVEKGAESITITGAYTTGHEDGYLKKITEGKGGYTQHLHSVVGDNDGKITGGHHDDVWFGPESRVIITFSLPNSSFEVTDISSSESNNNPLEA